MNVFKNCCKVYATQTPPFWYSEPMYDENKKNDMRLAFCILSIFLTICISWIPQAKLSCQACVDVAKDGKSNRSDLSITVAEYLINHQNVGFARKTKHIQPCSRVCLAITELHTRRKCLFLYPKLVLCSKQTWYKSGSKTQMWQELKSHFIFIIFLALVVLNLLFKNL